jgi:hypothetical protein
LKKFLILVIALLIFPVCVAGDYGIRPIPETQGVVTATTINAVGNLHSTTDVEWKITDDCCGLPGIPPLSRWSATLYAATYTEDTMSNGIGLIAYDKTTQLESKAALTGQSNIEATKQLLFYGNNGREIYSEDNIFLDGTASRYLTEENAICVFAGDTIPILPGFCNSVEAGSTFTGGVVDMTTATDTRFITNSVDTPVAVDHTIRVDYLEDLPSSGKVSAFMEGSVREGNGNYRLFDGGKIIVLYPNDGLITQVEWSEETSVDGEIGLFDKDMRYESGLDRVG